MTNIEIQKLCLSLMDADSENEVIGILKDANLWDRPEAWRHYGDNENNFSTIGNQQSKPDAALVEKLVNSEDARLMNECLSSGIDPSGLQSPASVRDAVAAFFEKGEAAKSSRAGRITNWADSKRTDVARGITLSATGMPPKEGKPCFTIADCGEGQTPGEFPNTLLSITRSNKLRIPFVQGKFNMGGTGALKFCGLQLIVSRRNPALVSASRAGTSDSNWGFTIVRREAPTGGARSSVYTYLAPEGSHIASRQGGVLHFQAESLPIFPEGRNAYGRASQWGTLIKLYEYAAAGYSNTHILRKDGLLGRIDLLLPDPALPIRLHECRLAFRGHEGSFETTLTGLMVRLDDDKADNLEDQFPSSCPLGVSGQELTAMIYAFKKGRAETYRKNEGLIFTVNGQTHGHLTKDFFGRKAAGRLNYIADSILVAIDCSKITGEAREDLFMNSRDRLRHGELRSAIEDELEEMLRQHSGLRALKERRRNEEIQSKLADEKPLEEVLRSLLEHSPALSSLFQIGQRASNPFKSTQVKQGEVEFKGKRHPTFFKFKDKPYGNELKRECHLKSRARITFETDAINDYFSRSVDRGEFSLWQISGGQRTPVTHYVGPNLQNGAATLSVSLAENALVGQTLLFEAEVNDPTLLSPFINSFNLTVRPEAVRYDSDTDNQRRKPPTDKPGDQRDVPHGISLPKIILINEADWNSQTPQFDKYTALCIGISDVISETSEGGTGESQDVYDFKINNDNIFLKTELKNTADESELVRARWKYGLVLVGLALIYDDVQKQKERPPEHAEDSDQNGDSIDSRVESFTRALGPVLLPMIQSLGALELDAIAMAVGAGEAT